jgi:hypothetical protein
MGAEAVVMDGLDATAVGEVVARAAPEVVVHQMTALNGVGIRYRERAVHDGQELAGDGQQAPDGR